MAHHAKPLFERLRLYPARRQPQGQGAYVRKFSRDLRDRRHLARAGWTFIFWGCLHGAALVVQRIWSELGFRLNKFVAWFITFNFVNIAWVFFRAKEWDDALKVLKGMFGLGGGLALNSRLERKVGFLREYGVKFDEWNPNIQIDSTNTLLYYLIAGFAVSLLFKNSAQKLQSFKLGGLNLTLAVLCFTLSVLNLHKMSQFLYFNF